MSSSITYYFEHRLYFPVLLRKSTVLVQIFRKQQDYKTQNTHKKFHTKISRTCEDCDKKKDGKRKRDTKRSTKNKKEYLNERKEGKRTAVNHIHTTITQRTRPNELRATVSLDQPTVYVIITSPPCVSNA